MNRFEIAERIETALKDIEYSGVCSGTYEDNSGRKFITLDVMERDFQGGDNAPYEIIAAADLECVGVRITEHSSRVHYLLAPPGGDISYTMKK